mmetsp:Transcript_10158/g.9849  ORF Transcript_10158/g.9849 Transcript_10158/m.9849 type:complete len:151 (+) Transcript_10158:81-533(+)
MSAWATTSFGEQLMTKTGLQNTSDVLKGKKYVGIYFSAHWCPPCRAFTPALSEIYTQMKQDDENCLEIVFASSDSDQDSFDTYYGDMPWVAIPFNKSSIKEELGTKCEVRGIPTLIIMSVADGSIVDADGRSTVSANKGSNGKILAKWAK